MPAGLADLVEVGGAHALLDGGRARPRRGLLAAEVGHEGNHPGARRTAGSGRRTAAARWARRRAPSPRRTPASDARSRRFPWSATLVERGMPARRGFRGGSVAGERRDDLADVCDDGQMSVARATWRVASGRWSRIQGKARANAAAAAARSGSGPRRRGRRRPAGPGPREPAGTAPRPPSPRTGSPGRPAPRRRPTRTGRRRTGPPSRIGRCPAGRR